MGLDIMAASSITRTHPGPPCDGDCNGWHLYPNRAFALAKEGGVVVFC